MVPGLVVGLTAAALVINGRAYRDYQSNELYHMRRIPDARLTTLVANDPSSERDAFLFCYRLREKIWGGTVVVDRRRFQPLAHCIGESAISAEVWRYRIEIDAAEERTSAVGAADLGRGLDGSAWRVAPGEGGTWVALHGPGGYLLVPASHLPEGITLQEALPDTVR
jgi:hypothetical protein